MTNKDLFYAIHECQDEYIVEVIEDELNQRDTFFYNRRKQGVLKIAVVALICIIAFGTGVSALAAVSDPFRNWLIKLFDGDKVTMLYTNDKDDHVISLEDSMLIAGEKESFVYRYHIEKEEEVVDQVYTIQDDHLSLLTINKFKGNYDGDPFEFQYVRKGKEIFAFNYQGSVSQVFSVTEGDDVYIDLYKLDETRDIVEKECIARLNLQTGKMKKISNDHMICNFVMSPNGKFLLCNHRSDRYWSSFDLKTGIEKKVKGIDGYAHSDEIYFQDDRHILTLGEEVWAGNQQLYYSTYKIDLQKGKIMEEYKDNGEIHMEWSYKWKNKVLKLSNITNGDSFEMKDIKNEIYPLDEQGDYVLFGNLENEDSMYLANLKKKTYKKLDIPKQFYSDIEIHLAISEKKLLVTNGKQAYLVDISEF